jgi:hypothetical protein
MGWLGRMLRGGISPKANRVCDRRRMRCLMNQNDKIVVKL